jgi:hypothetical protein
VGLIVSSTGGSTVSRIVQLKPEGGDSEYLPPTYYLKFTQDEFPAFLANPTATMEKLGHPVKNLTVTVKDHVWDAGKGKWITEETDKLFELPPASQWEWWCGYQDEMCVCERVLVP